MSDDGGSGGRASTTFNKFFDFYWGLFDKPICFVRERVKSVQSSNNQKYYHRQYRRVPTIDECDVEDAVCFQEANEQFKRDKQVDGEIMNILRQRRLECELYYGSDAYPNNCGQAKEDYTVNETNWYIKYGELGAPGTVKDAYMKQKHRMIWERRHGPVGSGMKSQNEAQ